MKQAKQKPQEQRERLPIWQVTAAAAALCWAGALTLLLLTDLRTEREPLAPQRLVFYALVLLAGLATFGPLELRMGLPYLGAMGVGGSFTLLYTLAFVPAPTDWLLALPDLPVYFLLLLGLFWSITALVMPFIYVVSRRIFAQRALALDKRRIRRQSFEAGLLVVCLGFLAGLRVLTWVSFLLVVLIIVVAELLFLSRVQAEIEGT